MKLASQGHMEPPQFQVIVSDFTSSVDEWRRAQSAPVSDLPQLGESQKEVARKFGISEEEYARSILAGEYGVQRMTARTRKLGEEIERIIREIAPTYRIVSVVAEMFKDRWVARVKSGDKVIGVAVPRELGDDFIDWGLREAAEQLRAQVLYGLGLGDQDVRTQ